MTAMEDARRVETAEYKEVLTSIASGEVSFKDHPGFEYLATGFGEGFGRGFKAGAGAAHAGISTVVGNIDNGMYDLEEAKAALIALRNVIQREAGL